MARADFLKLIPAALLALLLPGKAKAETAMSPVNDFGSPASEPIPDLWPDDLMGGT